MGTADSIVTHIGRVNVFRESFRRIHGAEDPLIGFLLQAPKIGGTFSGFIYFHIENSSGCYGKQQNYNNDTGKEFP